MRGEVSEFVEQLVESFRQTADQKGVTLEYIAHIVPGDYLFDADKWEKILTNLLSNALKFTGSGGHVAVTLKPTNSAVNNAMSSVQIVVQDTGIGIPSEKLPHVFDRFYQVDDSRTRAYEGTGIGLALVKELIELVGGSIDVESQPEKGTRFQLELPVQPVTVDDTQVPRIVVQDKTYIAPGSLIEQIPAPDKPPFSELPLPLVLIVEDNTELREFLATELADSYQILRAANGEEGWQLAQAELPDIVISDVMMPKMDGYELTKRIKNHPDTNHIAVVMLTAKAAQHSRLEGLTTGADEYLSKPFHAEELRLRLHNLVDRQQKLRDFYRRQLTRPDVPISQETTHDPFLQQVYELLEKHLDDSSLNVDWLADQLSMSRKTLYRKTHSMTQLAPNELIRHYRLRKAADLLRAGNNVTETAFMVGFKTASHFTIVFKEFYQQTPTEFVTNGFRSV